jgi:hypothetical protein
MKKKNSPVIRGKQATRGGDSPNALVNFDAIPEQLRKGKRFVLWAGEKVPKQPDGRNAKTDDPSTWNTFEEVRAAYEDKSNAGKFDGIGICLKGSRFVGIDMDNVINDEGELLPSLMWIIGELEGAYIEYSPSGRGLHIFAPGILAHRKGERQIIFKTGPGEQVEIYGKQDTRYLTLTGDVYEGHGAFASVTMIFELISVDRRLYDMYGTGRGSGFTEEGGGIQDNGGGIAETGGTDDFTLLGLIRKSKQGTLFKALFDAGDWKNALNKAGKEYKSHSEGTAALLYILAWWSGKRAEQMDRLYRMSAMYKLNPKKWERPQGGSAYGALEVRNAISRCKGAYAGNKTISTPTTLCNVKRRSDLQRQYGDLRIISIYDELILGYVRSKSAAGFGIYRDLVTQLHESLNIPEREVNNILKRLHNDNLIFWNKRRGELIVLDYWRYHSRIASYNIVKHLKNRLDDIYRYASVEFLWVLAALFEELLEGKGRQVNDSTEYVKNRQNGGVKMSENSKEKGKKYLSYYQEISAIARSLLEERRGVIN